MKTVCHALWLADKRRPEMRTMSLGALDPADLRIQARFGAISRGTERTVSEGRVPVSEYQRMRAPLQDGEFPFPVKYGYAVVGVIECGSVARIGERVFALHPHQDRFDAPLAMVLPIPDAVPDERAVLAANMETALNVVWDAGIAPGDRVAIVGGGLVGLLTGFLAAGIPGTEVTIVDLDPARAPIAGQLGCRFSLPDDAPKDCDIVIHASGTGDGLATAIAAAGFEARVVELSWYGETPVSIALGGAFHSRRLTIAASQVGHVPPTRRARWPNGRRLAKALDLLADARLDCLITGETRFTDLPGAYMAVLDDPGTLCHRIRYG